MQWSSHQTHGRQKRTLPTCQRKETISLQVVYPAKLSFMLQDDIKTSSTEENEKNFSVANLPWKTSQRMNILMMGSGERLRALGKGVGETRQSKEQKWAQGTFFSEFCKLHLMVKAKLAALSAVCGRNAEGNYIINRKEHTLLSKTRTTHWTDTASLLILTGSAATKVAATVTTSEGHKGITVPHRAFLIACKDFERHQRHGPQCHSRE